MASFTQWTLALKWRLMPVARCPLYRRGAGALKEAKLNNVKIDFYKNNFSLLNDVRIFEGKITNVF